MITTTENVVAYIHIATARTYVPKTCGSDFAFLTSSGNKHYIKTWFFSTTVKPVCNDHLYNQMYCMWFIQ